VVNSAAVELEASVSKDGLSLYIASNRAGNYDIWVSQRVSADEPWGPPQQIGPAVNTAAREQGPFLTKDGHRLYFFSDRADGFGGTDLYVSRRRDKRDDFGWEPPENLGPAVNTSANESLPMVFEDDEAETTTLYFTANLAGPPDIYASTLLPDETFGPPARVEELSSGGRDRILTIRRDGRELFLASDRAGPTGSPFDLWVATRASTADRWSAPTNVGLPVSSPADEGGATLSFDGTTLYFTSDRAGGMGRHDLWTTTRRKLGGPDGDE